jgi:hypothetical protein
MTIAIERAAHSQPLSIRQAADRFAIYSGRKPHLSTVWRWVNKGVRGCRLETLVVGGLRVTTTEAIERFIEQTNRNPRSMAVAAAITRDERQAQADADHARLAADLGVDLAEV